MKTAEEIAERIQMLQDAKQSLLFPIQEYVSALASLAELEEHVKETQPYPLESLNAEIAALTWVLNNGKSSTAFSIGEAIMDTGVGGRRE